MHISLAFAVFLGLFGCANADCNVCPFEWKHSGNYFVADKKVTWEQAVISCRCQGGYLVEPRTAAQNTVVSAKSNKWFWIGLSDIGKEGTYRWVSDKSEFTWDPPAFNPWDTNPNQPDDHQGNEDCIHSNHRTRGKWNDRPCNEKHLYICQKS